jgi:GH25 family lysozyme M1 (1,4-beta-N-acetylmuramidase)
MKLPGEEESGGGMGPSVIYMIVGVVLFASIVLVLVMQSNKSSKGGSAYFQKIQEEKAQQEAQALEEEEIEQTQTKLRAEDLDFWDMYPVEEEESAEKQEAEETPKSTYEEKAEKDRQEQEEKAEQKAQEDPSLDGKHTLVTNRDGSQEWVLINSYLKKNTYDFTRLEEKNGLKKYVDGGKTLSYLGADLSKYNGDVNFASMKAAGVDYVMIRVGSRGYNTGKITLDEKFNDYIKAASEAGLRIGVYFASQAISQEEASQEADFVLQNLAPYQASITYPVAFDMEFATNDEARIDGLRTADRTAIATTFLDKIKNAGYIPMVYGNKEWLIKEVDMTGLQQYDVWLSQEEEAPDYPYQFTMWQYTTDGVLNGVPGDVGLDISFVNYSER